jgi:hypothetical protein
VGGICDCWLTQWWASSPAWRGISDKFHILLTALCHSNLSILQRQLSSVNFWYPSLFEILESVFFLNFWCQPVHYHHGYNITTEATFYFALNIGHFV